MPQPAKPQNSRPGSTPLSRRRLLAGAGGAVAAGALFSRAGFASAAGQRSAAGRWFATSAADKPTLSQWYHGYGEEGVEDAVRRFAADYPDANVEVQWFPADYDTTRRRGAAHRRRSRRVRDRQRPQHRHDHHRAGAAARRHPRRRRVRLQRAADQAAHLRRPPVGRAADHRHVLPRLPQELARRRRHRSAGDRRRPDRRRRQADHRRPLRAVPRQRRWRRHVGRHGPVVGRRRLPHRRQPVRLRQRRRVRLVRQAQRAVPERLVAARRTDRLERPRSVHQRAHRHPAHRAVDVPGDPGVGDRRRLRHDAVAGAQLDASAVRRCPSARSPPR